MARLEAARRQFYASFIETATEYSVPVNFARDDAVQGVVFPKLRHTSIMLEYEHLPKIEGHNIEVLELDPHYEYNAETIYIMQDDMDLILEQIAVRCRLCLLPSYLPYCCYSAK